MKKTLTKLIIVLTISIAFVNCNDIIERDIAKDKITVISPADNFISGNYSIMFGWEGINGALQYRIQVASPNFSMIQSLVLDTIISNKDNKALITLFPGTYQWKIRAENGSSETPYQIYHIVVDTTKDLTNQKFTVSKPSDKYYINNQVITFSWPLFPYADRYEYLLTDTSQNKIKSIIVTDNKLTDTIDEGHYRWSVRGINTSTNTSTNYSTGRYIYIDITPPSKPIGVFPINNALVVNPASVRWTKGTDVTQDSLLIASDSFFTAIIYNLLLTDSTSYTLQQQTINSTLYWKIKSKDIAGNWSDYSDKRKFTITQ